MSCTTPTCLIDGKANPKMPDGSTPKSYGDRGAAPCATRSSTRGGRGTRSGGRSGTTAPTASVRLVDSTGHEPPPVPQPLPARQPPPVEAFVVTPQAPPAPPSQPAFTMKTAMGSSGSGTGAPLPLLVPIKAPVLTARTSDTPKSIGLFQTPPPARLPDLLPIKAPVIVPATTETKTDPSSILDINDPRLVGTELQRRGREGTLNLSPECAEILRRSLAAGQTLADLRQNELCASFASLLVPAGSGAADDTKAAADANASVGAATDVKAAGALADGCYAHFLSLSTIDQARILEDGAIGAYAPCQAAARDLRNGHTQSAKAAVDWLFRSFPRTSAQIADFCTAVAHAVPHAPSGAPFAPALTSKSGYVQPQASPSSSMTVAPGVAAQLGDVAACLRYLSALAANDPRTFFAAFSQSSVSQRAAYRSMATKGAPVASVVNFVMAQLARDGESIRPELLQLCRLARSLVASLARPTAPSGAVFTDGDVRSIFFSLPPNMQAAVLRAGAFGDQPYPASLAVAFDRGMQTVDGQPTPALVYAYLDGNFPHGHPVRARFIHDVMQAASMRPAGYAKGAMAKPTVAFQHGVDDSAAIAARKGYENYLQIVPTGTPVGYSSQELQACISRMREANPSLLADAIRRAPAFAGAPFTIPANNLIVDLLADPPSVPMAPADIVRAIILYADAILSPEAVPSASSGPYLPADGRSNPRTPFVVEAWKQHLIDGLVRGLNTPALHRDLAESVMSVCRSWNTLYTSKPGGYPVHPSGDPPVDMTFTLAETQAPADPWAGLQGAGLGPAYNPTTGQTFNPTTGQPIQPAAPTPDYSGAATGIATGITGLVGGYLRGEQATQVAAAQAQATTAAALAQAQALRDVAQINAQRDLAVAQLRSTTDPSAQNALQQQILELTARIGAITPPAPATVPPTTSSVSTPVIVGGVAVLALGALGIYLLARPSPGRKSNSARHAPRRRNKGVRAQKAA